MNSKLAGGDLDGDLNQVLRLHLSPSKRALRNHDDLVGLLIFRSYKPAVIKWDDLVDLIRDTEPDVQGLCDSIHRFALVLML